MIKRVSAATLALAIGAAGFSAPAAFASEETVATPAVARAAEKAPLFYATENKLDLEWNTEKTFTLRGDVPAGATFSVPNQKIDGWNFSVDKKTGELTLSASEDVKPGSSLKLPVMVEYSGSYQVINTQVKIVAPEHAQADSVSLAYPDDFTDVKPGHSATITPKIDGDLPAGTTFNMNEKNSDGWTFSVDEKTGAVTANLPKDAKDGRTWTMGLIVEFPDGSTAEHKVKVRADGTPENPISNSVTPKWKDSEVEAGKSVKVTQDADLPEGTTFIAPDTADTGWAVEIDKDGTATVTAPASDGKGSELTIPVIAKFSDGSSKTVEFKVTVK